MEQGAGRQEESADILVDAYCDDSVVNDVAVCGLVAVPTSLVAVAEGVLRCVKLAARTPVEARLHCRELLHADARRKSPWAHLSDEDLWAVLQVIPRWFGRIGLRFHVSVVRKALAPKQLDEEDGIPGMPLDDKQLLWFAFSGALIDLDHDPGFHHVRLWVDPDDTRVPFLGRRRQMKHVTGMKMFSDISGGVREVTAQPITGPKPPLLEVADVLAFTAAQALSRQARRDKDRFRNLFASFGARVSESFPGAGSAPVSVPPII